MRAIKVLAAVTMVCVSPVCSFAEVGIAIDKGASSSPAEVPFLTVPGPANAMPTPTSAAPTGEAVMQEARERISRKIQPCLNVQHRSTHPEVIVTIGVDMNANGTPASLTFTDKQRYDEDGAYRGIVNDVIRAVMNHRCQPWPLPSAEFDDWKQIRLVFRL